MYTITIMKLYYSNISLIDSTELERIQREGQLPIPTLPVNNIIIIGATLYQEDEEGHHMVISFASRVLNNCERNYNVTEKELLSVVYACNKFRTYILGYPVTVRSDHKSISFLKRCKLSHGRLTRWVLALQEYHINWEYIPCLLYTSCIPTVIFTTVLCSVSYR